MLEPLGGALQPVEACGCLLAAPGRADELALDAVALRKQGLELLAGAVPREACSLTPLVGLCPALLDLLQLELSDPRLDRADLAAQLLRPLRSGRLQRERAQALLDLGLEVARTLDVDRDPGELQLRPVPSPLEAPEPGGLLDELAPFLGLRAEDLLDAALADDRAHLAAEPDVGEQLDEIRAAHRRAVDEVLPLTAAVQPAHERDLRERQLGQRAVLVVEEELDLAVVGRRTVLPTREEDVVGLLGPQLARSEASGGPEQRIGDVRLAGAVRPDDDGYALLEANLDRVRKRLEAAQLDRSQVHAGWKSDEALGRLELGQSLAGGFLLRGLLRRALADAGFLAVDHRGTGERSVVRRAFDIEHRVHDRAAETGERLLQLRLVVDVGRPRVLDPLCEGSDDGVLDPFEPVLEEQGAERRLQEGREDVSVRGEALELVLRDRLGRPLRHPLAESQLAGDDCAARPGDDVRPDLRQLPLREVGVPLVELPRNRQLENAVAQELEALVGGRTIRRPGRVREDVLEPLRRELEDQSVEAGVTGAR